MVDVGLDGGVDWSLLLTTLALFSYTVQECFLCSVLLCSLQQLVEKFPLSMLSMEKESFCAIFLSACKFSGPQLHTI